MYSTRIIPAGVPETQVTIEFPDEFGIETFHLPLLSFIDRPTMSGMRSWTDRENEKRLKEKKPTVSLDEQLEYLFKKLVDKDIAKNVLARPEGEVVQVWLAWQNSDTDFAKTLGESKASSNS
ncbi:hypothetical protein KRX51_03230 [Corynebacterium sp. TAE3-ERU12]|uniref:hypothetical protein n=1 Tax=Corynebacterium sp. TAE3-ERU12 TaxID=2849491 RepID=UPI001C495E3C|nr:hypothetical protein [Corynebacterium sp. TAE3-ERU12]MBV7294931.1 hypothetical protein [Corynebacterium sp. TAE3-ERU12]